MAEALHNLVPFRQFITEGKDAPLYHSTSIIATQGIVTTDVMLPSRGLQPVPGNPVGQRTVSFTRNFKFALNWWGTEIVLEFDQTKLGKRYTIRPTNYYAQARSHMGNPNARVARPKKHQNIHGFTVQTEFEEVIMNKVEDVHKYLKRIIVTKPEHLVYIFADEMEILKELRKHPLLYDQTTKRFVNK